MSGTWNELKSAAVLGTGKAQAQPPPGFKAPEDKEASALAAAAYWSVVDRAGFMAEDSPPEPIEPSPPESWPVCEAGTEHLRACLRLAPRLVEEWLDAAFKANEKVPPELLPQILDYGAKVKNASTLKKVVGARGRWLAEMNPDWSYLMEAQTAGLDLDEAAILWQTGKLDERIEMLTDLRKREPKAAFEMVQGVWEVESTKPRGYFLDVLSINPRLEEEAFFEAILNDKAVTISEKAFSILASVPGTKVAKALQSIAAECVQVRRSLLKSTLEVSLPNAGDPRFASLGSAVKQWLEQKEMTKLLWRLLRLVAPSSYLPDPDAAIKMASALTEYREQLFEAWVQACALHKDRQWAEALLPVGISKGDDYSFERLAHLVTTEVLERALVPGWQDKNDRDGRRRLTAQMPDWTPGLALAVIREVKRMAAQTREHDAYFGESRSAYALNIPLQLIDEALMGWPPMGNMTPAWQKVLSYWQEVLPLRRDMLDTIRRTSTR